MSDAITITTSGWKASSIRRLRRALDLCLRDEAIHRRYDELRPEIGWEAARERVAAEFHLSERTIRHILYNS